MVLPGVLRFNLPACGERLAAVAFALGAGDTARGAGWNADAAIDAVAALADTIGMTHRLPDFGITAADFDASPRTPSTMRCWPTRRARRPGPTSAPSSPARSTAPARSAAPPTRAAGPGPDGG